METLFVWDVVSSLSRLSLSHGKCTDETLVSTKGSADICKYTCMAQRAQEDSPFKHSDVECLLKWVSLETMITGLQLCGCILELSQRYCIRSESFFIIPICKLQPSWLIICRWWNYICISAYRWMHLSKKQPCLKDHEALTADSLVISVGTYMANLYWGIKWRNAEDFIKHWVWLHLLKHVRHIWCSSVKTAKLRLFLSSTVTFRCRRSCYYLSFLC